MSSTMQIVDKLLLREMKLEKIQRQIRDVELQMNERAHLLDRLDYLNEVEKERTHRIVERVARGRSNFKINQEMDRLKIDEARSYSASPLPPAMMTHLLSHRTKEFSKTQQDTANQIRYLAVERQRLQDARERLREKRYNLLYAPSPVDSEFGEVTLPVTPGESSFRSVRSPDSYVKQQVADMPYAIHRIWKLREDVNRDYHTKLKPYNGELGLESYANSQLGDYVIVRKLVEDFVDDFLLRCIEPGIHHYERDMQSAILKANDEDWETAGEALAERRAVTLVAEELLLEQTHVLTREVVKEVFHIHGTFHNLTDEVFIKTTEEISTGKEGGRRSNDPAFNLITKAYFALQDNRNKHRKEIWNHTQHLHLKTREPTQQPEDEREIIDADVEMINFDHITPSDLRKYDVAALDPPELKQRKERADRFVRRELQYWKGMSAEVFRLTLGVKVKGISVSSVSPDHRFLAVGSVHGDIVVYDTLMEPWRPIRIIQNTSSYDDSVIDIAWSLDSSRLVSINRNGSLQVWSFDGGTVNKSDMRALDIRPDSKGYVPQQLARIVVLDVDQQDFTFQQGQFSEQGTLGGNYGPIKAGFFPSFTFLGTQHCVCVALDNGDMLKCNLEPLTAPSEETDAAVVYSEAPTIFQHNIYDEAHGVNLIGQNLEAELFRQHQNPIIHIGFLDNVNSIVTVDQKGFINKWTYDTTYQSGFGWFYPHKKHRLDMAKTMYSPSSTEKPNILYTDKVKSKKKTRQDFARERKRIQNTLENMRLGDPWHEEFLDDQGLVTRVYMPRGGVSETGAMFHVVIRYQETNQVSTYLTRMYKPVLVKCTKMLKVLQSSSGRELIFLLLFPKYPPKDAHMTVLVLDLITMKLRDVRMDIYLSETEYIQLEQQDIISCAVTRVLGCTGSDYLFILFNGRLRCVSLMTGKLVLRAENVNRPSYFGGCGVDEKLLPLPANSEVSSVCINGKMHAVMYSKKTTTLYVLRLEDDNDYETRRMMWKAFSMWNTDKPPAPTELRTDPVQYDLTDIQHKDVEMRTIFMEMVDRAIASCAGMDVTVDVRASQRFRDKAQGYCDLEKKVNSRNLLEGRTQQRNLTSHQPTSNR
ncbi:uncharacterized protein LOC121374984 [Gigantopelta aegis]|uniref:uncharacterized protein LOC121374984 n=1 Tax=Gigantopelta aegis TaxID=1735272 RepID=UPI001B88BE6B|nr:uncharacterized protein LOC121374984 [Gigantopelta aegis]